MDFDRGDANLAIASATIGDRLKWCNLMDRYPVMFDAAKLVEDCAATVLENIPEAIGKPVQRQADAAFPIPGWLLQNIIAAGVERHVSEEGDGVEPARWYVAHEIADRMLGLQLADDTRLSREGAAGLLQRTAHAIRGLPAYPYITSVGLYLVRQNPGGSSQVLLLRRLDSGDFEGPFDGFGKCARSVGSPKYPRLRLSVMDSVLTDFVRAVANEVSGTPWLQ